MEIIIFYSICYAECIKEEWLTFMSEGFYEYADKGVYNIEKFKKEILQKSKKKLEKFSTLKSLLSTPLAAHVWISIT